MKKLSILAIALLLVSIIAVPVFAAQTASISVTASSNTVSRGDTVTVTVSTSEVANCTVGGFMFSFNTDVFEYVSGSAVLDADFTAGVDVVNDIVSGYFMNGNATLQGDLFQITLKVKDTAAFGEYTVSGTPNIITNLNGTDEEVSCTVTNATITVACDHVPGDVVIENEVESTWEVVGSYDEVIYCTACGEKISRVTKDALLNPFYSNAMELSSQLTLHIIIKIDTLGIDTMAAVKESGYYAVVTLINDKGEAVETTIPASEWQGHTKNRMRIPFDAWNPTQMADALKVVLYNNDGEQISVAKDTSVREIAMYEIEQYAALGGYDNYVTLLVDMLNYGTASQNNFGYNTDDYANALLSDELKAYATADVVYPARKDNSSVAFFQSTAFELLSRVEMQLVLTNTFGVDVSQVVAEVSYTTFSGKLVEQTVSGTDFKTHTKGRFKCVIDWLDIPDCQQDVTIVFKDTDGNELATVTESVMSALGYYSELLPDAELYPALIKFINSASAYFAS